MFVSDKLLYLELPKTACSQIRDLLMLFLGGEILGKHNRLPENLIGGDRMIVGSVRNPWDWYISLWAFGCDRKGVLYERLTSRKLKGLGLLGKYGSSMKLSSVFPFLSEVIFKSCDDWRRLYSNSQDPSLFQEWLHRILDVKSNRKYSFGEGYALSPASSYVGIYTYSYLKLFLRKDHELFRKGVEDFFYLQNLDQEANIVDRFIRVENLEADLIQVLLESGVNQDAISIDKIRSFKPKWHMDKEGDKGMERPTNASSRVRDVGYYYDESTKKLVAEREQLIISKHGYSFPC